MKKITLSILIAIFLVTNLNAQTRDSIGQIIRSIDTLKDRMDTVERRLRSPATNVSPLHSSLVYVKNELLKREGNSEFYDCYNGKMTLSKSLDRYIYSTFDKVVVGNDEVVKNGTAINLSVSDKTKLSANYLTKLSKSAAFSFGFNAAVTNNETALINNKRKLQSGWGVSSKVSILPGGNGGRYFPGGCDSLTKMRKYFILSKLDEYNRILNEDLTKLDADILREDGLLNSALNSFNTDVSYNDILERRSLVDSLKKMRLTRNRLAGKDGPSLLKDIFDKEINDFEAEKAPWTGYRIHWFDIEASLNSTSKSVLYGSLISTEKISENKLFWKYKVGASYNLARVSSSSSFYLNVLLAMQNAYVLEGKEPLDTFDYGEVKVIGDKGLVYDVSQIPDYDKSKLVFSPSFLINSFYGKSKMLGWEFFFESIFRGNLPGVDPQKKVVGNMRLGFIVNFSEKYKTSSPTIGVFLKSEDYGFNPYFGRTLSLGLRVGVPFEGIFKKKS